MKGSKVNPRATIMFVSLVSIIMLWVLFFFNMIPGDPMDVFCILLIPTVLLIILMFKVGGGAISQDDKHDDAPDRFGESF